MLGRVEDEGDENLFMSFHLLKTKKPGEKKTESLKRAPRSFKIIIFPSTNLSKLMFDSFLSLIHNVCLCVHEWLVDWPYLKHLLEALDMETINARRGKKWIVALLCSSLMGRRDDPKCIRTHARANIK